MKHRISYLFVFLIPVFFLVACSVRNAQFSGDISEPLVVYETIGNSAIAAENLTKRETGEPQLTEPPASTLIPYTTPDWFREAVLYEIFVRSYVDTDGDGIGDIQGVISKLDYLESLGMDSIWLMPIYPSPSVHGYDVVDYFSVNPDYGTMQDIQDLVDAAHDRNMKVILDFVPSHLSNQNPIFRDAYGNTESMYSDWFVWTNDAHTTYAGFANNESMPRFNHYNLKVVEYLSRAALFWLDLDSDGDFTDGVDGFRVDNATFPPQEFLVALRQAVKAANPDALLLGETWVNNPSDMSRFYENQFDALFDFPLYELMQGDRTFNGDGMLAGNGHPFLITTLLEEQEERYPEASMAARFMSNHDTNRIASELSSDPERLRLAVAFLASLPDPIMVYYGEEIGMPGVKGGPPDWDNYRREPMDWYANESGAGQARWFIPEDGWNRPNDGISVEEQDDDPNSLLNYYRHVLNLRRATPALLLGDYQVLELEVSGTGPWGLLRSEGVDIVVALFNFSDEEREVTINDFPFSAGILANVLDGSEYAGVQSGQPYTLLLPPAGAIWLVKG